MRKKVAICLTLCFLFLAFNLTSASAEEVVKIGFLASLVGPSALYGMQDRIGGLMAEEDINKAGGILVGGKRYKVKVIVKDDESKPAVAVKCLRELANEGVHCVATGGTLITTSLIGLNEELDILLGTYSANVPLTQKGNKLILRFYPTHDWLAGVLGYVAAVDRKVKKIAFLHTGDDYGNSYKGHFSAIYKRHGGSIVADEVFKSGDTDLYTQLTSIKGKNPDAIQLGGYPGDTALVLRQTREILGNIQRFADDFYKTDVCQQVGDLADGLFLVQTMIHVIETPEKEKFINRYKKLGGIDPTWGQLSYEKVRCFARAMEVANTTTDALKIRNAMQAAAKDAVTLGGVKEWLPNGDVKQATVGVFQWDASKGKVVKIRLINSLDDLR